MTAEDKPIYVASEWGARYHMLTHNEALGGGAAGPGKSFVLLADVIPRLVIEERRQRDPAYIPPGFDRPMPIKPGMSAGRALHLRRTMPQLKDTLDRAAVLFKSIDPGADYNAQLHTWTFTSGYRYQFGHCKDPNDWYSYQSNGYDWIGFDELVQFLEEQYDQIGSRARTDDPVLERMIYIRSMSNPVMDLEGMDGVAIRNPNWVRDRFVAPHPEGGVTLKRTITYDDGTTGEYTMIYLHATLKHNPNAAFRKRYELQLQSRPHHIRQALLYGNWFITANSYFAAVWNEGIHTCNSFQIPPDWPICRSMDWGFKTHGCILWGALDPDGTLFIIREYVFIGKSPEAVAKRIQDIEDDFGIWDEKAERSLITGPADTQLWEHRGDSGAGKAEEFAQNGVQWVPADKKSRARNAERCYLRLADHANYTTAPGLIIFRGRCPKLIETLPSLQTDKDTGEPADGGFDHPIDALFYMCAFTSRGKKGVPRRKVKDEFEEESPKKKRSGRAYGF